MKVLKGRTTWANDLVSAASIITGHELNWYFETFNLWPTYFLCVCRVVPKKGVSGWFGGSESIRIFTLSPESGEGCNLFPVDDALPDYVLNVRFRLDESLATQWATRIEEMTGSSVKVVIHDNA